MASYSVLCPRCTSFPQLNGGSKWKQQQASNFSSSFCSNSRLSSSSSVAAKNSSNSAAKTETKSSSDITAQESLISTFINEASVLVKMVDSREIVELRLKQLGCELVIRKQDAVHKPQAQAPDAVSMPPYYAFSHQSLPQPTSPAPIAPSAPPSPPAAAPLASANSNSPSHPPLKCPMAGTFYRSPGPGEPPFVKVGDKVQKGQVICIIEAMKLMNEIEADQSGTVEQILVDDGKPVSVDLPLFVIVP